MKTVRLNTLPPCKILSQLPLSVSELKLSTVKSTVRCAELYTVRGTGCSIPLFDCDFGNRTGVATTIILSQRMRNILPILQLYDR